LVHTGQNYDYELNQIFFDGLKIRNPDYYLNADAENGAKTIAKVILLIDPVLEKEKPEALLVLGDTNSCMAVLPAKRRKIPIFHMEAGNRCFDMRVPEEINRRLIDHLADVNLTYSSNSRDYLLREGLPPDMIIKTGSPMAEVLDFYSQDINASKILEQLKLKPFEYFLFSSHREENVGNKSGVEKIVAILNGLVDTYSLPVIVSTHPRTRKALTDYSKKISRGVELLSPLSFHDYNYLQKNAKVVLSDSGTISEEASISKFPALNIREMHERPEAMEEASVMMVGMNWERIVQCVAILNDQTRGHASPMNDVQDYKAKNVSLKIVRIIHSYTDYIRRVTWKDY
jgi:UDP-N-acetylglucosamine 2-epimerase (non-hydrolysing)